MVNGASLKLKNGKKDDNVVGATSFKSCVDAWRQPKWVEETYLNACLHHQRLRARQRKRHATRVCVAAKHPSH